MSSNPNEIEEKIKKLLRMDTKSGATQAEVEQAIMAAQRLAARYNLDLATIDASDTKAAGEPIVSEDYNPTDEWGDRYQQFPANHKFLVWILSNYFAVELIEITKAEQVGMKPNPNAYYAEDPSFIPLYKSYKRLNIIGRKTNVHIAIFVYGFLHREFTELWRAHKLATGAEMTARNSFFYGVYLGLAEKLNKEVGISRAEKQAELTAAKSSTSLEMVLIGEKEKIDKAVEGFHPRLKIIKRDSSLEGNVHDYNSANAGLEAGKKITIRPTLE